jgi:protein O-mannosyl-transferase
MPVSWNHRKAAVGALLALITLVLYLPVRDCDFLNYDDDHYVTRNVVVQSGRLGDLLRAQVAGNWHPVTLLSHALDVRLFGLKPAGHHLVNLAIHTGNVILLFGFLSTATGSLWRSAFVAALFALHPLNIQSVAWIAERKNVLSTFFWFLALRCYVLYVQRSKVRMFWVSVAFLAVGLLAKPMLVTFPFLLLLLDIWPLGRVPTLWSADLPEPRKAKRTPRGGQPTTSLLFGTLIREKWPMFLLVAVSCMITVHAQRQVGAVQPIDKLPMSVRLANAVVAYVIYLRKAFWPNDLAVFYPHPGDSLPLSTVAASAVLLVLISWGVLRLRKPLPCLAIGWFWFLGTLVPVIGLVQVGAHAIADRYTYVPLIGVFVACIWTLHEVVRWAKLPRAAVRISSIVLLVLIGVKSRDDLLPWKSSAELFRTALLRTPGNYMAHNNIGTELYREGRLDQALEEFRQTVRINPAFVEGQFNLGTLLLATGRFPEAVDALQVTLKLNPEYAPAHNNLGAAYLKMRRWDDAIASLRRAIELKPNYSDAYNNLKVAEEWRSRKLSISRLWEKRG